MSKLSLVHPAHIYPDPDPSLSGSSDHPCIVLSVGPHLVDNQLSFEDGHEVAWLLPHANPDLHRGSVKLLIYLHCLVGRGCQLILGGVAALQW